MNISVENPRIRIIVRYGLVYATAVVVLGLVGAAVMEFPSPILLAVFIAVGGLMSATLYDGVNTHMESSSYGGSVAYSGDPNNLRVSKISILYKIGFFGFFLSMESFGIMMVQSLFF